MKGKESALAGFYVLVLFMQAGWHWLLTLDNNVLRALQNAYLYRSQGGRGVAGFLDLMLPGIVLGALTGYLGWQWQFKKLALFVFFGGAAIVALTPLYVVLLRGKEIWWWPRSGAELFAAFVFQLLKAWTLVGAVTFFAGYLRRGVQT